MFHWHIVTGEYPPQPGGVSDYTHLVANELAQAGDEVEVLAPECGQPERPESGFRVRRLPGHFGPRALAIMGRAVANANRDRLLVQYVPHAFGLKAMNLPFSYWLFARRRLMKIDVMFHEVAFARRTSQPLRHNLLGEVTSLMAMLVARSAERIFVSCLAWEKRLRPFIGERKRIQWLPVPSTVPVIEDPFAVGRIRATLVPDGGVLVGHLGTYGANIRRYLETALPQLLRESRISVILLGRNAARFREALVSRHRGIAERLHVADSLPGPELSLHLGACDLMLQPYPDGISSRRTSAMAALAHRRAVVSTVGHLTEPLWTASGAVATVAADDAAALASVAARLAKSRAERERIGGTGAALYRDRFHLNHTTNLLRATKCGLP